MHLDVLTQAYIKIVSSEKPKHHVTIDRLASRTGLIEFYKGQLRKFSKIGLGKKTEFDVLVTPELMGVTIRRIEELQSIKPKKKVVE